MIPTGITLWANHASPPPLRFRHQAKIAADANQSLHFMHQWYEVSIPDKEDTLYGLDLIRRFTGWCWTRMRPEAEQPFKSSAEPLKNTRRWRISRSIQRTGKQESLLPLAVIMRPQSSESP